MGCLGLPDFVRVAESGLGAVPGAAEHLAGCEACAAALGAQVRAGRADGGGGEAEPVQYGRYQLLGERGRGAFGRVFEAYDPALDRRVAVKLIAFTARSSSGALAELLHEAKAMAQIQHANVIPIFDAGRAADGVFITMPIVDGETVDAWAGRADADRVIAMFATKIAAGLAAIHAAGFVHRDVKPSNVLVAGTGAWIADLGLARRTTRATSSMIDVFGGGGGGELTASMHTESFGGTPAYMAPECLAGGAATPAADQYALAVTLVEVVTGQRPFAARTYLELLDIASTQPPRLDGIPRRYHAALARALRPEPAQRFPSVAAFAAALTAARTRRITRARAALLAIVPALVIAGVWLWSSDAREGGERGATAADGRGSGDLRSAAPGSPSSSASTSAPVSPPGTRSEGAAGSPSAAPAPGSGTAPTPMPGALAPAPGSAIAPIPTPVSPASPPLRSATAPTAAPVSPAPPSDRAPAPIARTPAPASPAPAPPAPACVDRCAADHQRALASCAAPATTAACADRARSCAAACTASARTCEAGADAPAPAPAECRAAWMRCRDAAAAAVVPLERARRAGWDDCAAANAACRRSAPPGGADACAATLRQCNAAVAAAYERGKALADRDDQRCLTEQQACFARGSGGAAPPRAACRATADACLDACAVAERGCADCRAAAGTALAACRRACAP